MIKDFKYSLVDDVVIVGNSLADAYVESADYNGVEMTHDEIDEHLDSDFVSEWLCSNN